MLAAVDVQLLPIDPQRPAEAPEPVPFWDETHASLGASSAHRAWYIVDGTTVIGVIGASDTGDGHQVGYGVSASREGQGATTRALHLLLDTLRDEGVERVVAETFDDHVASRRVMEKAGMRLVDERRDEVDGEERDLVVYEVRFRTARASR